MIDSRELRLLCEFKDSLSLTLEGLIVATEAGSGPFLFSALAAALAGAKKIIVVCPDSEYASHNFISSQLYARILSWGLNEDSFIIVKSRSEIPGEIDIFLNLGFLRPLNEEVLSKGSKKAVVSYMSESWEFRPGDLDLDYCRGKGILVAGVDEDFEGFGVFSSCGQLALKLLFEAGVEVAGCKIAVLSDDPFGDVIERAVNSNAGEAFRFRCSSDLKLSFAASIDAILIASYSDSSDILENLSFSLEDLQELNPSLKFVQFAGVINYKVLSSLGFYVYPPYQLAKYRMAKTLSGLGVRPVLALHSLGLKVGQLLYQERNGNLVEDRWKGLIQRIY